MLPCLPLYFQKNDKKKIKCKVKDQTICRQDGSLFFYKDYCKNFSWGIIGVELIDIGSVTERRCIHMKRSRIAIFIVMVICCFGYLTGCSPKEDDKGYDASLISEKISEDGTYKDECGSMDYTFHVPQIKSESEDAKKINQEIMDKTGIDAQEALKAIEKKEFPLCSSITWSDKWNGSMLSLLITEDSALGLSNYTVYNFDFKEEKIVKNEEIFKRLDITEEEFLDAAKKAAFCKMSDWSDEDQEFEEYDVQMYYESMYPFNVTTLQNIDPKTAKVIAGKDEVQMILDGFIPAGGGTYTELLTLDLDKKKQPEKSVEYKGITAKLKDGKVSVQYAGESLDWIDVGSCLVDDDQLTGGKEYTVSGCYRDYVDLFISQAGNAQNAYLYLLTKEGDLEMVNLIKGASAGVLSSIPVPYIMNIETVEETVDSSQEVCAYAVDKDGEKHDLSLFANIVEKAPHQFLSKDYVSETDSGESHDSYFEIAFDEEGKVKINEFKDGESKSVAGYYGAMMPLGCNDEGTIYYFDVREEKSGEIYIGSFLIRSVITITDDSNEMEFGQVEMKVNTGVDILKTKDKWIKVNTTMTVG